MKFIEIFPLLQKLGVFSINDLKVIDDRYNKDKIAIWSKKGYIIPIKQGFYILKDTLVPQGFIANKIYNPSYVSLESGLNKYGIIPEYSFTTTCVSTKKTIKFQTHVGNFTYNTIKSSLFWGYSIKEIQGKKVCIAELEKCIIDFLYLRTQYTDIEDFRGLRWNIHELRNNLDTEKLLKYSSILGSSVIQKKVKTLLSYIQLG